MRTSGNTILITGGGSGIGLAMAQVFAKHENNVIICGRRRAKLIAAKKKTPQLITKVCDVSRSSSRKSLVHWLEKRFPALNVLVNNAGIQCSVDLLKGLRDIPYADEEVATNFVAPIHLSSLLIPMLRKKRQAAIVNISSGLAFTPIADIPVYCATKAALHSFCLSLRHQLRRTRVRVFEIAPPMVATDLHGYHQQSEDSDFIMSPDTVAQGVLSALKSDKYEVILGGAKSLYKHRDRMFSALN